MRQLLIKIALFLGYSIFACWSAYMTAMSIHLKWLSEMPFILAFIMIFIISLVAGWCLTNVIKQLKNSINPSKSVFVINLLGFLLFWGFSFMTNVHYSLVTQHGYDNINRQLQSCISYLKQKTDVADAEFNGMKTSKKENLKAEVTKIMNDFHKSLNDTRDNHSGFGDECIGYLKAIQQVFVSDTTYYHDKFDYVIFDEKYDSGDIGETRYNRFSELQDKYDKRIQQCLNQKYEVIDRYYDAERANNDILKETLTLAKRIEKESLPQIKDSKSFKTYYECYDKDLSKLLGKMPLEYTKSMLKTKMDQNGNEVFDGYVVYPSDRMFDFVNVWKDWFNGYMPEDVSLAGKMPLALIFDIVAFVLICLI